MKRTRADFSGYGVIIGAMRKTILIIAGVVLICGGAIALLNGGIPFMKHHNVDFGVGEANFTTHDKMEIPVVVSVLLIAGGAVMIGLGAYDKK